MSNPEQSGVQGADQKLATLLGSHKEARYYPYYLERVGLIEAYGEMTAALYAADPSLQNEANLLQARHSNELWRSVFKAYIDKGDAGYAADYVRRLAEQLRITS